MKKETARNLKELAYYSSLGMQLAFSVVIGFFLGSYLDKTFNTHPWLTYLFLIFGIAAGFRNIALAVKRIQKSEHQK